MTLTPNRVDYSVRMTFTEDGVNFTVEFTGESVRFDVKDDTLIRPRHIKLVAEIQQLIRDYIRR